MLDRVFIATTGNGLARASRAWVVEARLGGSDVRCLAADPVDARRVYAGTQGRGVLRSDDRGRTWRPAGLRGHVVKAIAASPAREAVVYAGTKPARLFVSHDAGDNWAELDAFRRIPGRWRWFSPAERPYIGYVQGIALSPSDPLRLLVGIEAGATVSSVDGGRTWSGHRRGALRDCHALAFHASAGAWAYAGGGGLASWGTCAISRDGGRTWANPRAGLDCAYGWAVAADPARPEVWYLSAAPNASRAHGRGSARAGIFRHDGTQWRRLTGGLPRPLDHMPYALLTDRGAPGHLYVGLGNGDLWHSADFGEQWTRLSARFGQIARALVML